MSWIQWVVRMIKKDMNQYEEDVGTRQEVYKAVKRKSKYSKDKERK